MKFNFKWGQDDKQEMTPELTQYAVNTYVHPNTIKGSEHLGQKQCRICGKWFTPGRINQIACSKECSKINQQRHRTEWNNRERDKRIADAAVRGDKRSVTIVPTIGYGKTVVRGNNKPWTPPIKRCKICGKEFEAKTGRQVYCSQECSQRAKFAYQATYYKRNRKKQRNVAVTSAVKQIAKTPTPTPTPTIASANTTKSASFWQKQSATLVKLVKSGMDEEFVAEYLQMVFGNK